MINPSPVPCIQVKDLSKSYRLGSIGLGSFVSDLKGFGHKIGLPCKEQDSSKDFLALDKICFDAFPGEALGIIGHNGAGKSTLLKILSRITEPSSGEAILKGKVASLLEVGTGFHPDMTGRENIFLNGTLLGLSKREIKESFDSIVRFAHVEKFIDTPVKRYSSGMYVRLAFAVAAHLNPYILIVDEVLAVGDIAFQKKCIQKMHQVADSGMTILFVSHNLQMIKKLCKRSILLEKGQIVKIGKTSDVISYYTRSKEQLSLKFDADYRSERRRGVGFARFNRISYLDCEGNARSKFKMNEKITFCIEIITTEKIASLRILILIRNESQQDNIISLEHDACDSEISGGKKVNLKINLDQHNLMPGSYPIYFWAGTADHLHLDVLDDLLPPLQISEEHDYSRTQNSLCQSKSSIVNLSLS
jgi:lipopolysaccharide transport system ATP-binding protein